MQWTIQTNLVESLAKLRIKQVTFIKLAYQQAGVISSWTKTYLEAYLFSLGEAWTDPRARIIRCLSYPCKRYLPPVRGSFLSRLELLSHYNCFWLGSLRGFSPLELPQLAQNVATKAEEARPTTLLDCQSTSS